jgi:hypothetical protein
MPVRVLYTLAVFFTFVIVAAIFWFVAANIFAGFESAGVSVAQSTGSNGTTYSLVDTFFTNLWMFFLALALLGFAYWAWIYSQRNEAGFNQ